MAVRRLLRALCPHWWGRQPDRLECYGMGLEWMEVFRCRWCGDEGSQVRGVVDKNWINYGQPAKSEGDR